MEGGRSQVIPADSRGALQLSRLEPRKQAPALLWLVGKFWSRTRRARDFGEREPPNHSMAWWCGLAVASTFRSRHPGSLGLS